jgi:hypothetical protein
MNPTDIRRWAALMLVVSSQSVLAAESEGMPSGLFGFIKQEVGYSYQHEDFKFSKIRTSLGLGAESNFDGNFKFKVDTAVWYDAAYKVEGRAPFTDQTLDVYETDFRFNEAYLDIDLPFSANLRIGRQYFSWGESMGVTQISDIGNPRDLKELGLQNVEFARLPIGSTKLTFFGTSWEYNLIALHEFRPYEFGAEGSEFDPLLALRNPQTVIRDPDEPKKTSLGDNGVLTRLFLSRNWGDISFFWGKAYEGTPALTLENFDANTGINTYLPEYQKVESYGFFGNVISGSWSFLFDVARKQNLPIAVSPDAIGEQLQTGSSTAISWRPQHVLQSMLGFEYSGLSETIISMEYLRRYIEDYDSRLADDRTEQQLSLYVSREFLRDTLTTTFWVSHDLGDKSNLFRIDLDYAYNDHLRYSLGVSGIDSNNPDSFFYNYRKTDRVTVGVKYSF